ncbi:MAG: hypothetical protein MJ233_01635 [Mycoplasmoidaceae bacterium]|nr:hypothetical protein [Mycoplasmoidaceae bacterium]
MEKSGKKVKYIIKDENTLELAQDAHQGDFIDLRDETNLDTKSVIKNFNAEIENLAKQKAIDLAEAKVLKASSDKEKEIADLKKQIALLQKDIQTSGTSLQDKIDAAVLKAEAKKNELINSLKETINSKDNEIKNLEYR